MIPEEPNYLYIIRQKEDVVPWVHKEYQGPDWFPFHVAGYFEEYHDAEWNKYLGVLLHKECPDGRILGSDGRILFTLTHEVTLQKGHKSYVLKASPKRPIQIASTLQIQCGRSKPLPNEEQIIHTRLGDFPRPNT